jgi:hypothetical protein
MNIFVLDEDQSQAARYHVDKHVVKMILETAQLLSAQFEQGEAPYKRTHYNHPCSIWTRNSKDNFMWLVKLGYELSKEYGFRYQKKHKSSAVIKWCEDNVNRISFKTTGITPFAQAMPDEYKSPDAVEAYRQYYIHEKSDILTWKNREVPFWCSS